MSDWSFVEELDKHVIARSGLVIPRPGLYPSSASVTYVEDGRVMHSGGCLRGSWYRLKKVKKTEPSKPGLMMKANLGKWAEEGIVEKVKEMGFWIDNNVKFFQPEYIMSGELDFIIQDPEQRKIGIEMKTFYGPYANKEYCGTPPRKYKTKGFKPGVPGRPKEGHMLQALIYCWEYIYKLKLLDEYRIFYLERGDGHRVEFELGFDNEKQAWYRQVEGPYWSYFEPGKKNLPYGIYDINKDSERLIRYVRENKLPPRCYKLEYEPEEVEWRFEKGLISESKYKKWKTKKEKLGDFMCSYCDWCSKCKKEEDQTYIEDVKEFAE